MKLPKYPRLIKISLSSLLVALLMPVVTSQVHAGATLSKVSDTLSSMTQGVSSTHTIVFTESTNTAQTQITLVASSNWGSQPTTGWTVTDTTASTAMSGVSVAATNATTFTITFGSYTPAAANHVFTIVSPAITNWASSGTYTETVTVNNTASESGTDAVLILSSASANQLSLTAQVGPSISFTVSGGPLTLPSAGGNMTLASATANKSSQASVVITTNAANGASITVQDANSGLFSSSASHTIATVSAGSAAALSTSTEGFGMGCPAPGTGTVNATYLSTYANAYVGNVSTTSQNFWTDASSFSSSITLQPYFNANVIGGTPAGTYTDTVTYIATASF